LDGRDLKTQVGAVLVVLVVLVLAFASIAFTNLSQTHTVTISTTKTITFSSVANSHAVIEEVIIQPEVINSICIGQLTNLTSTAYLIPVSLHASSIGNQTGETTTTETLRAINTVTVYDNATVISGSITCTLINPHYNVTQSSTCPPCV
jgi:hypothetical protein